MEGDGVARTAAGIFFQFFGICIFAKPVVVCPLNQPPMNPFYGLFLAIPALLCLAQLLDTLETVKAQDDAVWMAEQLINAPRVDPFTD